MSELDASKGSLAYARMPPICASASRMSTPGMMGRAGKCPWNQGSSMVTHLWPAMRSSGHDLGHAVDQHERPAVRQDLQDAVDLDRGRLHAVRRSVRRRRALVQPREGAQPPGARHGRISCHDGPGGYIADDAALGRDARAVAHGDVIGDAHLAADEHARGRS